MKRFIDLEIKSSLEVLIDLLSKLKQAKSNDWYFETKLTSDYSSNISTQEEYVACFQAKDPEFFESTIWMVISNETLKITNIVSRKVSYLGKDLYNEVLTAFYEGFIIGFIGQNCSVNITSSEVTIEELANSDTAEKLKKWEFACNKSTGNTHPYDRERWFDFIMTAVDTDSDLTPGDLEQWLIEDRNWVVNQDDDIVTKVIIDFENGVDLLKYYVGKY